jgi:hypothetical protein
MMHTGENDAKLKTRLSKSSPLEVKILIEFIRRGISVYSRLQETLLRFTSRLMIPVW